MTISSKKVCFEARCKCGVGFIHTQLASSYANAPQQLASSRSTVGFITRDFHTLISRQHSQTNRHGLYTLFLTSKSRCMQKISSVDALLTTQNVLSRSGRFGGGHTGWSQLQLASSVSPLCYKPSSHIAFKPFCDQALYVTGRNIAYCFKLRSKVSRFLNICLHFGNHEQQTPQNI